MEVFSIVFITIFGLIFGSFLAMLVYRLPLGISLLKPKRSICPQCDYQIKWYENIPLFSYFFLQGKCSKCQEKISFIYPTIEALTAIISLGLYLKIGFNYEFLLLLLLSYTLVVLSFIDLKYKAVPDYLLIFILIVSIAYILLFKIENIITLFIFTGAIVILEIFVTFYIQNIKSKIFKDESLREQKSLGEGDIPIFAMIGGILGVKLGMVALFLSAILAIIPSIINSISKKEVETPFIPFLSVAFLVVLLSESYIIDMVYNIYGK